MNEKTGQQRGPLRVAYLSGKARQLPNFAKSLEEHGLSIVARYSVSREAVEQLSPTTADVILVDLNESSEKDLDVLDTILQDARLPVLFNDSANGDFKANNAEWCKRLATKLWSLTKREPPPRQPKLEPKPFPEALKKPPVELPKPPRREKIVPESDSNALNVWVLAASLGGPLAVREFLTHIPADLPVAFVLAQHIGASHLDLLAEQLDRATPFKVMTAQEGLVLKHHEVVLVPVDQRMFVDLKSLVHLKPIDVDCIYKPCIDVVMSDLAERYGKSLGAIVFSGMGNDGELGCYAVANHGGTIWAQDAETCVISSMPDNARKTGHVSYTGTPEELAQYLITHYSKTAAQTRAGETR